MVDNLHECVYLDEPIACEEIHDEIIADAEEIESDEKKCVASEFYVVMGYNEQEHASLLGLFSSEEAAAECGQEHLDCKNIIRYEIENPTLDEFGFK